MLGAYLLANPSESVCNVLQPVLDLRLALLCSALRTRALGPGLYFTITRTNKEVQKRKTGSSGSLAHLREGLPQQLCYLQELHGRGALQAQLLPG